MAVTATPVEVVVLLEKRAVGEAMEETVEELVAAAEVEVEGVVG